MRLATASWVLIGWGSTASTTRRCRRTHASPYRRQRLAAYRSAGDQLSAQFLSYDMADERQHVAYGRKWLPQLMALHGITTPVDQFVDETVSLWEAEYRSGVMPIKEGLGVRGY